MVARGKLNQLKAKFGARIHRADLPADYRLFVYVEPAAMREVAHYLFRELDARYVVSIGADDRPYSGQYLVAHNFAFDRDHLLCSVLAHLPPENPSIVSIADAVPGANWAEREFRDLVGIEPVGHPTPKRLVLPDGWPEGSHPLRKDLAWNDVPAGFDEARPFPFEPAVLPGGLAPDLGESRPRSRRRRARPLRVHLAICAACTRMTRQLGFLRKAARQYPGPDEGPGK